MTTGVDEDVVTNNKEKKKENDKYVCANSAHETRRKGDTAAPTGLHLSCRSVSLTGPER